MTETETTGTGCPSPEMLSEFTDEPNQDSGDIEGHLNSCGSCRDIVEVYCRINQAARLDMAPPQDLAERIKQACRGEALLPQPMMMVWWARPAVRAAAALVVTGILGVLALMAGRDSKPTNIASTVLGNQPAAPVIAGLPSAAAPKIAQNGSILEAEDVRAVDTQGGMGEPLTMVPLRRASVLPSYVKHVWSVNDLPGAQARLKALLPEGVNIDSQQSGHSRASISISLRDEQLQKLVNRLAANHWDLVTSALPQPSRDDAVRFLGRAVRYDLELVEK